VYRLQGWKPADRAATIATVKPLFVQSVVHPNLKRTVLGRLNTALAAEGFPAFDRAGDVDTAWQAAGTWLAGKGLLQGEELVSFLRAQVFCARTPDQQRRAVNELQRGVGTAFPVRTPEISLPRDWIATWRWVLKTSGVTREEAVRFLCDQMRDPDALEDETRRALLMALKEQLGDVFPLPSTDKIDLENDWPTCGNWLIEKGYFGKPKKKQARE
jgi:hypothetical protein